MAILNSYKLCPGTFFSILCNAKKAAKVLKIAQDHKPQGVRRLVDKTFSANDILRTPYANAGLYCFDLDAAITAINACGSDNAQGEIYLTDTLEIFARQKCVTLYEVANPDDMLTYSTKPELIQLTVRFMRNASDLLKEQNPKLTPILQHFIAKFGDKKVIVAGSPGRINLMGRHIDHHGGGINVMALDRRRTISSTSPISIRNIPMMNSPSHPSHMKNGLIILIRNQLFRNLPHHAANGRTTSNQQFSAFKRNHLTCSAAWI